MPVRAAQRRREVWRSALLGGCAALACSASHVERPRPSAAPRSVVERPEPRVASPGGVASSLAGTPGVPSGAGVELLAEPAAMPPASTSPRSLREGTAGSLGVDLAENPSGSSDAALAPKNGGRPLGVFRNTYYDFPLERDYAGRRVSLYDARCRPIARVPVGFHDAVCVQGSGLLESGRTVSFAKRGCECARRCPRTGQKICFEALDPERFPFGRGAMGKPVVPLESVAVDSGVIPLGTPLFIPEYVGAPRDAQGRLHDGCFIAQDRGIKVRGAHVDIFTGGAAFTALWNGLVPSNRGVTVIADSPRCAPPNAAASRSPVPSSPVPSSPASGGPVSSGPVSSDTAHAAPLEPGQ